MLFLLLTYSMIFKSSVLGKLRGDLIAALTYVTNWYQIWVGPGVHGEQRLRAAAPPLEPRRRGAVLPHLAGRDDADDAARRHAAAGDDRPLARDRRPRRHGGHGGALPRRHDRRVHGDARRLLDASATAASRRPTRSTCRRSRARPGCCWAPRSRWCGARGRSCAARCATARRLLDLRGAGGLGACSDSSSGSCTSSPSRAPTRGCSAAACCVTALATLMVIAAVTHRYTLTGRVLAIRAAGVDRHPLVRAVPVPLADLPDHPQGRGHPADVAAVRRWRWLVTVVDHRVLVPASSRCRSGAASSAAGGTACGGARSPAPRQVMAVTVVVSLLLLAVGVIRLGLAELQAERGRGDARRGRASTRRRSRRLIGGDGASAGTAGDDGAAGRPTGSTQPTTTVPSVARSRPRPRRRPAPRRRPRPCPRSRSTTWPIGDSVMLGAAGVLTDRGYTVDAHVSRQMIDMVPIIQQFGEARPVRRTGRDPPRHQRTVRGRDARRLAGAAEQRAQRDHAQRVRQPLVDTRTTTQLLAASRRRRATTSS